jgi:GNAT superfamily N-acetyltransferase
VSHSIEVTRTYLEMRAPAALQAAGNNDPLIKIEPQPHCSIELFRFLYREVGKNYFWTDRLPWTDDQIKTYLDQSAVSLWLMTYADEIAGYFELKKEADGSTEIAYFGLMPKFIGRGLGKHLLTSAVAQAWSDGAQRVWLHTCTDDDPAALPNYLKRGFKPFKTETYTVER